MEFMPISGSIRETLSPIDSETAKLYTSVWKWGAFSSMSMTSNCKLPKLRGLSVTAFIFKRQDDDILMLHTCSRSKNSRIKTKLFHCFACITDSVVVILMRTIFQVNEAIKQIRTKSRCYWNAQVSQSK